MGYQKDSFTKFILCIFAMCIFSACWKTLDITNDDTYRGGYNKGMILVAQKELLIMDSGMLWDFQPDISAYKEGSRKKGYLGILEPDTKIKIIKIELFRHVENGDYIYPIGLVLDGKWQGKTVNLHFTSSYMDNSDHNPLRISTLGIDPSCFIMTNE